MEIGTPEGGSPNSASIPLGRQPDPNANRQHQVSRGEALDHVEEIPAGSGFHGLFFGPNHFAHLIGKAGETQSPKVLVARRRIANATRAVGKLSISQNVGPHAMLAAQGHPVVAIGADAAALGEYFPAKVTTFHGSDKERLKTCSELSTTRRAFCGLALQRRRFVIGDI